MRPAGGVAPLRTALEKFEWDSVLGDAMVVAKAHVRDEDLDEAVNEGARRVLDGTAPWDPASGVELSKHVAKVGVAALRTSARKHQRHSAAVVETAVADSMAPPPSTPEAKVMRSDAGRRLYDRLVGHFAGDAEALAVVACIMGSIIEAADQAQHTGFGIERVRNIRKRVDRRIDALCEGGAP
jgi:hypothetical protein